MSDADSSTRWSYSEACRDVLGEDLPGEVTEPIPMPPQQVVPGLDELLEQVADARGIRKEVLKAVAESLLLLQVLEGRPIRRAFRLPVMQVTIWNFHWVLRWGPPAIDVVVEGPAPLDTAWARAYFYAIDEGDSVQVVVVDKQGEEKVVALHHYIDNLSLRVNELEHATISFYGARLIIKL